MRIINHGAFAGLGVLVGVAGMGILAGRENIDAVLVISLCAVVGACLWGQAGSRLAGAAAAVRHYGGVLAHRRA